MRKRALLVPSTLAALALAAATPGGASQQGISFVQVTEKEWQLTLSRASVKKGRVIVEVLNFGTDNHDLVVQGKKKGAKQFRFKVLDPRGRTERSLTLTPGRYALWCSLPQHKQRGMSTTLIVRS
jgi:uncharacterized cupredoxin-like copper-binding protein